MYKLLVVEDEEILREAYRVILQTQGYDVSVAPDGDKALSLCKEIEYDLILLDLMMPRVDGVMFLERYAKYGLPPVRTIILSNLSSGEELLKAQTLGATANFVKADMSPRELLDMVRDELAALKV